MAGCGGLWRAVAGRGGLWWAVAGCGGLWRAVGGGGPVPYCKEQRGSGTPAVVLRPPPAQRAHLPRALHSARVLTCVLTCLRLRGSAFVRRVLLQGTGKAMQVSQSPPGVQ